MNEDARYERDERLGIQQEAATDPLDLPKTISKYFDEWCGMRLARFGVTWRTYRDRRLQGTWNETAERLFPGRDEFKVEGERRDV